MRILIILTALILLPEIASAAVFTPMPNDKSVELLGYIFGSHVGSVYLGGSANPALVRMFELLNTVVMSVGIMIVSYIGIVSTINTAQEGQTMGKKWSSIWIPLRAALGMLVLIPTPASGFSSIQVGVMWLILQGVGAADHVWNSVLQNMGRGLTVGAAVRMPEGENSVADRLRASGKLIADDALRSTVCMVALNEMAAHRAKMPSGFKTPDDSKLAKLGQYVTAYTVNHAPYLSADRVVYTGMVNVGIQGHKDFGDLCGKFHVSAEVTRDEFENPQQISQGDLERYAHDIYLHKILAVQFMFSNNNYLPLAKMIVDESIKPRSNFNRLAITDDMPIIRPAGYNFRAIETYKQVMSGIVKPQEINDLKEIVHQGMETGWLSAGSFYFILNKSHELDFFKSITVAPNTELIPTCDQEQHCMHYTSMDAEVLNFKLRNFLENGPERTFLATRLWDAHYYWQMDTVSSQDTLSIGELSNPPPVIDANDPNQELLSEINNLQKNMSELIAQIMHEQDIDPLIAQGRLGVDLMIGSEQAWINQQAKAHALLHAPNVKDDPDLMSMIQSLNNYGSLAATIYGIIWVIGATLAVYIPLIPYMIFTIGVVGWLLLVIEAMVGAPVMALSFILPGGEELGKVAQGAMILLNIILRPVLMLFGFVLSIRLYQAVIKLINFGLLDSFHNLNTVGSLFAWVAIIMVYAGFVVALSNKCFSLIYGIPDKILRWMGGAPEHNDPSNELHHVKGTMSKGAETINSITSGFAERNLGRLQGRAKQLGPPDEVLGGTG